MKRLPRALHVAVAAIAVMTTAKLGCAVADAGETLPPGFVHLRSVDETINHAIRYAGELNFTGKPVPGYEAAECVLTKDAANALKKAQSALGPQGLGLRVFDCYRPKRSVAAFVRWAERKDDRQDLRQRYYPHHSRKALFPAYIARRSGHSRGSSVDLTLIDLSKPNSGDEPLRDGCGPHRGGVELDMGTGFDCFDAASRTDAPALPGDARKNRMKLLQLMREHGFRNYTGEWWHFTFRDEPFPHTYFDFPVRAAKKATAQP